MKIELISTGTELLRGSTINTNQALIGTTLASIGQTVSYAHTVGDCKNSMIEAIATALNRCEILIITGGLGPTSDDITRDVVAHFFGKKLITDTKLNGYLRYLWRARHGAGKIPASYFNQAQKIEDAEFLPNQHGTAPGQYLAEKYATKNRHIFILPGPPKELKMMLESGLIPKLKNLLQNENTTNGFLIAGCGELEIQTIIEPQLKNTEIELAYCASVEGTKVFASGKSDMVKTALELIRKNFPKNALADGKYSLAEAVVEELSSQKLQLGLAESCTGGMISSAITSISGSSAVFPGGIVSYANEVKMELLGVSEEILINHGAVSGECASAMALGAKRTLKVDIAGSVTGIAGPSGGSDEKPVGTVFMALALPDGTTQVAEHHFRGDRESVRLRTCATLLLTILRTLKLAH